MPRQTTTVLALRAAVSHGNGLLEKLLDALPTDVTERLLSQATLYDVASGELIIERGVRSESVGYVLDGTLAMVQVLEDSRKHIIGLLVPTDIYGRLFGCVSRVVEILLRRLPSGLICA
jgi:CRP-like cAMP-binding protein